MTQKIDDLIAAGEKCTKFALDTAQSFYEGETCECPLCDGDGYVVTDTYMNMDGVALNVQFSGIGDEFINWQKFVKLAANAREDIKAMRDEVKRLRDLLEETGQRLDALHRLWCEQNGCPAHLATIANIERIKQALGDKRDE